MKLLPVWNTGPRLANVESEATAPVEATDGGIVELNNNSGTTAIA
jgi:hypothetical protein